MKTLKILILIFFSTAILYGQNWNNIINTGLSLSSVSAADALANKDGINLVFFDQTNQRVNYALLASSGTVLKQKLLDSDAYTPPIIVGDNTNLFAVYVKNGSLKVLRSTNLFDSWTDISPTGTSNIPVTLPPANRFQESSVVSGSYQMFDAAFKDGRLHVAWTETVGGFSEAYYSQYSINLQPPQWIFSREEITEDYVGEKGGRPRIAVLPTQLIFSYNLLTSNYMGNVKTRYRLIDGPSWGSSVYAFTGTSIGEEISSDNTYIHFFYYLYQGPTSYRPLYHKKILIGYNNWGTATLLADNIDLYNGVKCSKTSDGAFNISYLTYPYSTPPDRDLMFRRFSNNTWGSPFPVSGSLDYTDYFGFSSVSNDLYFGWFNNSGSSVLYYRQYDAVPITPTNFTGTSYNNHPKLTWDIINGPDVVYEIWRLIVPLRQSGTWALLTTVNSATGSFVDYGVELSGGSLEGTVYYKVRATDQHPYSSGYTGTLSYNYYGLNKVSKGLNPEYSLTVNFPNPFNPTTIISYSIKEEGLVTLKVYDMLGNEVAELVNEVKPEGFYEVEFNASNLPSGVYIYRLQAGKFTAVNKMILMR